MRAKHLRLTLVGALAIGSLVAGLSAQQAGQTSPPSSTINPTPLAPAAPPEPAGAISGVVVDGMSGKPLAGSVVSLFGGARGGRGLGGGRQRTDEKGRFIFTKLPPGDGYVLSAVRIGYSDTSNDARIVLTDGQWLTDAKISLWKLGSIGGVVTDEAGEPVVGTWVRVLAQVLVSGTPQLAAGPAVLTDDRGAYRIPGLLPGKYFVNVPSVQWSVPADTTGAALSGYTPQMAAQAEAAGRPLPIRKDQTLSPDGQNLLLIGSYVTPPPAGGRAMAYPMTFYPAARTVAEATVIDLRRGEERSNADLQLRPVPAVRVSGMLDQPAGSDTAGLTLRLVPAGLEGMANGSEAATALAGADGRFTFLNVPAGDFTLIASRSQMEYQTQRLSSAVLPAPPAQQGGGGGGGTIASATSGTQYNYRNYQGSLAVAGRTHVNVGGRDVTDVVVLMKRGVTVSGRIVYETATPPPVRAGGAGTTPVYAEPAFGDAALGMPTGRVTTTGPDTTFLIEGLLSGQYFLRFLSTGVPGAVIKSLVWDGKDYTLKPLDATDGRDLTGITVTITDKPAKLNGFVHDDHGQLSSHGSVIIFPVERDQWTAYGFSPKRISSTPVTNSGTYRYLVLRPGDYYVIAVDDALAEAWQDPKFLAAAAAVATRLTLAWDESKAVDVVLQQLPGFKSGGRP